MSTSPGGPACHHGGVTTAAARPYHHGNLRAALLEAAVERARLGGPDAVSLRDVAHEVGVSPSAAYRHVRDRDHLMALVSQVAREELARTMAAAVDEVAPSGDPAVDALLRFAATGRGYLAFARGSTPLFRTAFVATDRAPDRPDDPDAALLLLAAVDDLVHAGLLRPDRRSAASTVAWSSVHGLACLLIDDAMAEPFGVTDAEAVEAVLDGVARAVLDGDPEVPRP